MIGSGGGSQDSLDQFDALGLPKSPIKIIALDDTCKDTASQGYNAELVKQLTPAMQAIIANYGSPLE